MKKFGKASAMTEKYEQRLQQGYRWLKELLEVESRGTDLPAGCPNLPDCQQSCSEDLKHAFDKIPTSASLWVLALFISSKCFGEEGQGLSTAWQIYSAFKQKWHQADPNGKYQGRWVWDEKHQCGHGNPALSTVVDDVIYSVKTKQGAEGTRLHSCAMKKKYMELIMDWSNKQCPSAVLQALNALDQAEYQRVLPAVTKHYFMCAFAGTGWTLWTRNFELAKLQYKHIIEDARTEDAYMFRHLLVTLENRKGWQNKLSQEKDLHGHKYEIYPQREMPAVDMEFHFREWLDFLRVHSLQKVWSSLDHRSHTTQFKNGWMNLGGAQYRFMYAPVGKRWSLATIRWWGGWAEGEHLYYYEEGHGDALRPIPREADVSFLGEHAETRPATKNELRAIIGAQLDNMRRELAESYHSQHSQISLPTPAPIECRGEQNTSGRNMPITLPPAAASTHIDRATPNAHSGTDAIPCNLCIPLLPGTGPMNARWKRVVKDWEEVDLSRSHYIPLKDWKASWYTGPNRTCFGVQYHKRKLIALEFIEGCGHNESTFLEKWPVADTGGPSKLLDAIQAEQIASGSAKPRNSKL
ncbi:hypothetical protein K439DRAFT_1623622 [Ramaria rubella]|nr:hypothetical protein K439DRAFT_1623622 [Ramaria rubella]